jgi:hypothetical protein
MASHITARDLAHMKAFPARHKTRLMREIMTKVPVAEKILPGNSHFVKTIRKLRADGLRLIDLQPREGIFTSIWYRREGSSMLSLLGRPKLEFATMVVWEVNDDADDITTVRNWQL